jgi:hypothetical protein
MGAFESFVKSRQEPSEWHDQVARNNAAAAQARELRARAREEKQGAPAEAQVKAPSDLEELSRGFHQVSVEAREEKPMKGVRVARAIPNHFQYAIDQLAPDHELRRARAEGRIRYDTPKGRWVVDGVAPAPAKAAVNGHFPAGFFTGTAMRQRERNQR